MFFSMLAAPSAFDFAAIFGNFLTKWYLYVILAVFVSALLVFAVVFRKKFRYPISGSKRLTTAAVAVALCFIANAFSFGPQGWKFSLTPLVCFITGFLFPPHYAFFIGFTGDLIAGITVPQGVYNPIIGIASGIWALVPSLFFCFNDRAPFIKTAISYAVCFVVCSLLINTMATYYMYFSYYSKQYATLGAYFLARIAPTAASVLGLNMTASLILVKPLANLKRLLVK